MVLSRGRVLLNQFIETRRLEDLDESIQHFRTAIQLTPHDHSDRLVSLGDLGSALQRRFEQTGQMEVLDESIEHCRAALVLTPNGHPG
jgi:hypothetical protein